MDLYSKALEFFVENGITLNEDQINALQEKAKFKILPQFKNDPELKEANAELQKAQELLNDKNITTNSGPNIIKMIARVWDICENISVLAAIPLAVLNPFIILNLLFGKLISWALRYGQQAIASNQINDYISKLNRLKSKTKDEKTKKQIDESISKLKNSYQKLSH